ncbi:PPK2 family polyphosphate kinase [Paenimyroides aestuarii]|uniref:Polyphosphate kinase 2 family protein n=1 Tax=Paenimyroides aestuarii TaxID=2968490 RepID=A0ABY5NRV4_9FLAO|nr:PPK2 family polyphosphate kinase [Paenimyroides aestuarii]UUV21309.1 polyphosphate kinase 2 family protein [Paenimyroides aestuarii]
MKRNYFKVPENLKLDDISTNYVTGLDPLAIKKELKKYRKKIAEIQDMMYAHDQYAVLICFQGMDTAGKDSMIREVFKGFNARGVVVESFKTPSYRELQHDFMWRHYIKLPEKGKFTVFNRTQYENVLVTRVHPEYLLNERNPKIKLDELSDDFWNNRMKQMVQFEKFWADNGTIILKFFLHLSKEEQKNRLLKRIEKPHHQWKFSPVDLKEREQWQKYQFCYEEVLKNTSHKKAPWYIIPSDNKDVSRLLVAKIIYETLKNYKDISYPKPEPEILEHINKYKKQLME